MRERARVARVEQIHDSLPCTSHNILMDIFFSKSIVELLVLLLVLVLLDGRSIIWSLIVGITGTLSRTLPGLVSFQNRLNWLRENNIRGQEELNWRFEIRDSPFASCKLEIELWCLLCAYRPHPFPPPLKSFYSS